MLEFIVCASVAEVFDKADWMIRSWHAIECLSDVSRSELF